MTIKTLIALRELAANDLEAATATAEYTRAQLNQKQELPNSIIVKHRLTGDIKVIDKEATP